jgi:DNA repair protein RecO (recombination protein O)
LNHSADNPYFNLREGLFQHDVPDHPQYLSPEDSSVFFRLLGTPLRKLSEVKLSSPGRDFILETILIYYKIHLSGFGTIRSHEVLRSVFS